MRNTALALWPLLVALALAPACSPTRAPGPNAADPDLLAEIRQIKAIDNHAHPVRWVAAGEKPDRGFDALPVESMEPESDPVALRPGSPAVAEASRALYGAQTKAQVMAAKGAQYPAWVLDQMGVETMVANRVEMGPSIEPPRFRWVPYADALIFPLDNARLAARTPDRKGFFALEDQLRQHYLDAVGLRQIPATLAEYLARVVTPTLERQKQGGALAEKFEAAYLRSLAFDPVDQPTAARIYAQFAARPAGSAAPAEAEYKPLQDFLFRYIAAECGRLGMAVHLHTMAGAGGYFDVAGANPLNLESVLNDPGLRKTRFVMLHGGWPFIREIAALLAKPNAYLDFSQQSLMLPPVTLAGNLREWLELNPEKVLFATDAYPYSNEMGWEESGWVAARNGREALAIALTAMLRDGEITRARASELARMVLRENARALYGL
ncbi:MAG TPA: amidohydrolase family protein [Bryobacteraceae bacterium]|nr:amidohydrolase family protein [Bryobacteraceae bacterium]